MTSRLLHRQPLRVDRCVTEAAATLNKVPQGAFYDYLAKYGAGRELQKVEQTSSHTQTGYGLYSYVSYILIGQSGPPGAATYERAGLSDSALLLMSLMPLPSGQPPYSICDSYTFVK